MQMDMPDEYPTDTYHISLIQGIVVTEIESRSLLAKERPILRPNDE